MALIAQLRQEPCTNCRNPRRISDAHCPQLIATPAKQAAPTITVPLANDSELIPWPLHTSLAALRPRQDLVQDYWDLLDVRKDDYLPPR